MAVAFEAGAELVGLFGGFECADAEAEPDRAVIRVEAGDRLLGIGEEVREAFFQAEPDLANRMLVRGGVDLDVIVAARFGARDGIGWRDRRCWWRW